MKKTTAQTGSPPEHAQRKDQSHGEVGEKTKWTLRRLQQLFERYRKEYWGGNLYETRIVIQPLDGDRGGTCSLDLEPPLDLPIGFRITIDVDAHWSDQQIQSTLLHEMGHVAALSVLERQSHGAAFKIEIENLFVKGAPLLLHQARYIRTRSLKNPAILCALAPLMIEDISTMGRQTWSFASMLVESLWRVALFKDRPRSGAVRGLIHECKRAHRRARRRFLAEARQTA